jgi:hypothetical protein
VYTAEIKMVTVLIIVAPHAPTSMLDEVKMILKE